MSGINYSARRIRIEADVTKYNGYKDLKTGSTPKIYRGTDIIFEVGLFWGSEASTKDVIDIAAYSSVSIKLMRVVNNDSTLLASKTVTSLDTTVTKEAWADESKAHASIAFSAAETNIAVTSGSREETITLVLHGVTTAGKLVTFGDSNLVVREDFVDAGGTITLPENEQLSGTVALAAGAESGDVVFAPEFVDPASLVLLTLIVPTGSPGIHHWVEGTPTETGFSWRLGAQTPNANYKLKWLAIQ